MKVFVLEDDPNRVEWMKKNFSSKLEWDLTDQADEAVAILKKEKYDLILLDHDLGGEQMVDRSVYNTGYTVANKSHETKNKDTIVIVHSYNPAGAKNMMDVMKDNNVACHYFYFIGNEFINVVRQINNKAENE